MPWDRFVAGVLPFLITRQIFAGAGKMGIEARKRGGQPGVFQISQRADFFTVLVSIDTMNKRPLVNTRDEPHADAERYRRFHVIIGDSNMSEWATALKIGTTALVLDLIERGKAPQIEIAQPINATKSISRDQDYDWIIELRDGRKISAIDVQRLYLDAAPKRENSGEPETTWLLREWETVLNDLERDVTSTRDRVDWVAKKLSARDVSRGGKAFLDRSLAAGASIWSITTSSRTRDCFTSCCAKGRCASIVSEEEIKNAIFAPPETTRAYFRGRAVARFNHAISSIQWDEIAFKNGARSQLVTLPEPADDERLGTLNQLVREDSEFEEFFQRNREPVAASLCEAPGATPLSRRPQSGGYRSIRRSYDRRCSFNSR